MDAHTDFFVHLVIASVGAYVLILFLKRLAIATNKVLGGKLSKPPWSNIGEGLDIMLPVLPAIPAGLFFMMWPADIIVNEPLYQFLSGAAAGSVSANLYELVVRILKKRARRLLRDSDTTVPPDDPK